MPTSIAIVCMMPAAPTARADEVLKKRATERIAGLPR
jgi:hypothetical protein